ncbi:hypothetical protein WDW86_01710 [Bdellovibrionota bacterium FG-2]
MRLGQALLITAIAVTSFLGAPVIPVSRAASLGGCVTKALQSLITRREPAQSNVPSIAWPEQWSSLAAEAISNPLKLAGGHYSAPIEGRGPAGEPVTIIKLFSSEGVAVGEILYHRIGKDTLKVDSVEIKNDPRYRKKGLATALFTRALESNPATKRITGTLESSNREAFVRAQETGKSDFEAIQATPAYAIRWHLGFKRVVWKSLLEPNGTRVQDVHGFKYIFLTMER